jgi:hypothetical protein
MYDIILFVFCIFLQIIKIFFELKELYIFKTKKNNCSILFWIDCLKKQYLTYKNVYLLKIILFFLF